MTSRKGTGILARIWKSLQKSSPPKYMGTDLIGNQYYELEADKDSEHSHKSKPRRYVQLPGQKDITPNYLLTQKVPDLPSELESWLRFRRDDFPSIEELQRNVKHVEEIQLKAEELEKKYAEERKQLIKDGLIIEEKEGGSKADHVHSSATSFPTYEEYEINPGEEPSKLKSRAPPKSIGKTDSEK